MAGEIPQATKPQEGKMISPLVSFNVSSKPQGQPKVGDLVTVVDFEGTRLAARLNRHEAGNVWVTIIGFPKWPYGVGDTLVLDESQLIDW
jgi:hypothetical protein